MALNVRRGGGKVASPEVPTPSESIVAAASKSDTITTDTGKVLTVRKLGALDEMRMSRAVGRDASNEQYMMWCALAASIGSIDGDIIPMPETQLEFEAVIQRIGDDGVAALMRYAGEKAAAVKKRK